MPLPVKSIDFVRGVSDTNQTAPTSTDPGDGWTLVKSKSQRPKSVADGPSLPGTSSVKNNSTLQGSNSTAKRYFSANRVELQELKYEKKSRQFKGGSVLASSGFAVNTDYAPRQSQSSPSQREDSPREDFCSTDQEPFSRPDVECTEFPEYARAPASFSHPSWDSSTESRTVDSRNSPISQWESLEQISSLKIHGVLTTKVKLDSSLDRCISPQVGSNIQGGAPRGVSTLCAHFLEDNRKGQPYRYPNPCSKCTKHSKILYGIWRSGTKEWQVMRPYPKDVNPNVRFQLCRHFSNRGKCQKNPCTFAHGKEELIFWTSQRQSGSCKILSTSLKAKCNYRMFV